MPRHTRQPLQPSIYSEYDFYLRIVRNCNNNTTVKYIKNFEKIIFICLASGYMMTIPF